VARILIVEPHADIRSLFEHVVRRAGHEPVVEEVIGSCVPDVDAAVIEPGDGQGLAVARRLRELGRPIVFASIFPAEQEMLDLEPAAYFVKPFALAELEHALGAALCASTEPCLAAP
jgi:DNA-binding response OmpR family regulator